MPLHQHTRAAHARKSANMVSADMASVALKHRQVSEQVVKKKVHVPYMYPNMVKLIVMYRLNHVTVFVHGILYMVHGVFVSQKGFGRYQIDLPD